VTPLITVPGGLVAVVPARLRACARRGRTSRGV